MGRSLFSGFHAAVLVVAGSAFLTGCQQGASGGAAGGAEPVRESELRAYCPPVTLRDGTASFRTYEGGGEGSPDRIIYQAAISDTTRACSYAEGMGGVAVAVAGRVVPGPRGRAGTITMPIRVVAVRGNDVLYSQLHQHSVTISDTAGATQFLFTDANVAIPGGIQPGVRLMVGFDEGPR